MKINVEAIEGYSAMTAEEKLAALENYEFEDSTKLKEAFNRTSSQVADLKRQLKEKNTAEENKRLEEEEAKQQAQKAFEDLKAENDALKKSALTANYEAKFVGLGFDKDLANKTAVAMADGKNDDVLHNIEQFKTAYAAELEKQSLKGQPSISTGSTPDVDQKLRKQFGLS